MNNTLQEKFTNLRMRIDRRDILLSSFLVATTLFVFAQTYWNGFSNWDDPLYVENNRHVLTGLTGENVAWAVTTSHADNWHPLTWLSLQLDASLFGTRPSGFHLTNVFLHAANVALLFWTLRLMTGESWASTIVALLFAFHPLHVESVAWIAERKDVLSTFFWMLTCLAYGWYAQRPGWMRYFLAFVAFAAGLMSKPMLVTLPFVLLLLDYWPLNRLGWTDSLPTKREEHPTPPACPQVHIRWLLLEKLPFFVLAAGSCALTLFAQEKHHAVASLEQYSLGTRVTNALMSYGAYIGHTFFPIHLGLFYPHPSDLANRQLSSAIAGWQVLTITIALATVTVFVCAKRRAFPYLMVGWLWYLGTLVPVIGLVQVGEAARADRYTYIPLVGLFVAGVWACLDLSRRWRLQRAFAGLAVLLVSICVAMCYRQLQYWRNDITLWEHTLRACGESPSAYTQLGIAFQKLEDFETAGRLYEKALSLDPNDRFALLNLGTALLGQGKVDQAIEQLRKAVRKVPHSAPHHYYYGAALATVGRTQEAIAEQEETLRLDQNWTAAHKSLGTLLSAQDRFDEAIPHLRAAVAAGLGDPLAYYNLGRMLAMQGNFAESAESLKQAISLQQRNWRLHAMLAFALHESGQESAANEQYRQASRLNSKWVEALNQEAWLLATNPDARKRSARTARQFAQQVCQATAGRQARFLDTLAAAEAEAGNFSLAIETAKHAIAIASSDQQASLAREITGRLQLYEKNQPIRTDSGSGTR
jgi:tetratricopeptide (TPR) repeat protein